MAGFKKNLSFLSKAPKCLLLSVYMSFMWHLSSLESSELPFFDIIFIDKIAHIAEYAVFAILIIVFLSHFSVKKDGKSILLIIMLSAFIWGSIDEMHQSFVPSRDFSIFDIIADLAGGYLGYAIYNIKPLFHDKKPV